MRQYDMIIREYFTVAGKCHHVAKLDYLDFVYEIQPYKKVSQTRMWASAQHEGCPAEYRWCRLLNAAKFGYCPLLECHAVKLPI